MKVRGVQAIEITIDESQVKKITLEKLRKLYDLPEGSFIKGNMICYEHEVHTSHSWWETVEYRKVAKDGSDSVALEVIHKVEQS